MADMLARPMAPAETPLTGGTDVRVRVRYIFGLRDRDGERERTLVLPARTTVFEVLQMLGLSALELLPAVNGETVPDGSVLADGDELLLIPAIQGG
jgi:sulfur carrier protein ThiS